MTELHADFTRPVRIDTNTVAWQDSPEAGVQRRMLDRIGDEVARATSIVRFEPGATFPHHVHELGEEFFVLSGVFTDDMADYPAGTYARHPPGTSHAPWSTPGCELLVKLRQFDPADGAWVTVDTNVAERWTDAGGGARELALHAWGTEVVRLLDIGAEPHAVDRERGAEILVLDGELGCDDNPARAGTWLRFPPGAQLHLSGRPSARIWLKTGHLG